MKELNSNDLNQVAGGMTASGSTADNPFLFGSNNPNVANIGGNTPGSTGYTPFSCPNCGTVTNRRSWENFECPNCHTKYPPENKTL